MGAGKVEKAGAAPWWVHHCATTPTHLRAPTHPHIPHLPPTIPQLLKVGMSQMSAGSRTDVGAYHRDRGCPETDAALGDLAGQFSLMAREGAYRGPRRGATGSGSHALARAADRAAAHTYGGATMSVR